MKDIEKAIEAIELLDEKEFRTPRKYPFTDIGIDSSDNLFIDIAVPGFNKDDIEVERQDSNLVIRGTVNFAEEVIEEYIEQNILQEDFERIIVIEEKYQNDSIIASVEDGMLTIIISPSEKDIIKVEVQ